MSLQRYGMGWDEYMEWDMSKREDGLYVLYEDAMEEINKLKERLEVVECVNSKQEQFVCNTIGKALGFPIDLDGKNICCGDDVLESLCEMGAKRISSLGEEINKLKKQLELLRLAVR